MATTKEYKDFVLEQLNLLDNITCKSMMGEYLLYYNGILFGGIYDDRCGPFGAVIVKDGKIVGYGNNKVLKEKDPTAHAEVMAIREACKKLNTHDLTGCVVYTTSEPCPMCLSAIIWSNIKEIYFATDRKEVAKIGFRDDMIYNYLENKEKDILEIHQVENKKCYELLENYNNELY